TRATGVAAALQSLLPLRAPLHRTRAAIAAGRYSLHSANRRQRVPVDSVPLARGSTLINKPAMAFASGLGRCRAGQATRAKAGALRLLPGPQATPLDRVNPRPLLAVPRLEG